MGTMEVEEVERVVESCFSRIQWHLQPPSKRWLLTDILILYTRLCPIVMIGYGGKMSELQEHLCQLLQLVSKELMEHASHTTMRPLYVDLEEVPLKHSLTYFDGSLSCMKDTHVTIPTLTGWLLGYPVVYLFGKDNILDAVNNLSTQPLNLYKLRVTRRKSAGREHCEELLMSFAVPYNLSMQGKEEPWAIQFLTHMIDKFERCRPAWASLQLKVIECCPQAVL